MTDADVVQFTLGAADALALLQTDLPLSEWSDLADEAFNQMIYDLDINSADNVSLASRVFYSRLAEIAMTATSGARQ